MKQAFLIILILSNFISFCHAQSVKNLPPPEVSSLMKIVTEMKNFEPNFSMPPDDKVTAKIIEYRSLRGGFNINEAIEYKMAEAAEKKEMHDSVIQKMKFYFTAGEGKQKLNNAMVWIYREKFSYPELKKLVSFARTAAGAKMFEISPVIMLQSLATAEMLGEEFKRK